MDASATRRYGGTGLGLTISKMLVELMRGEITVASEYGKGTAMTFTCVLEKGPSASRDRALPDSLRGKRVLAVTRSAMNLEILRELFEEMGLQFTGSDSLDSAVAILREAGEANRFALALFDILPSAHGVSCAVQAIREELPPAALPKMLALAGYMPDKTRGEMLPAEVDGYIFKPVMRQTLYTAVLERLCPECVEPPALTGALSSSIPRFAGQEVLLVEDNPINQQIAVELLEEVNLHVTVAGNGREAVDAVRSRLASPAFDLIFMDLQMPVMDGYQATRLLRDDARHDAIPIVAMTAHALDYERDRCMDLGMNAHISKPIEVTTLYRTLEEFLKPENPFKEEEDEWLFPAREAGFDTMRGLERLGGNEAMYRTLLGQFHERYKNAASMLRQLHTQGQLREIAAFARTVRGLSRSMGHAALAEAAENLEAATRANMDGAGGAPDCGFALDAFASVIEPAIFSLGKDFDVCPKGSATADAFDKEKFGCELDRFEELLRNSDAEARELFREMTPGLRSLNPEAFSRISQAICSFDFDSALEQVCEVRNKL